MSEYHLIYFTPRQYLHFSYVCIHVLHLVYFFISPVKICLFFVTHRHDNDTATTHTHRFLSVSVYSTKISILLYDSVDVSTRLQFQSKAQNEFFFDGVMQYEKTNGPRFHDGTSDFPIYLWQKLLYGCVLSIFIFWNVENNTRSYCLDFRTVQIWRRLNQFDIDWIAYF